MREPVKVKGRLRILENGIVVYDNDNIVVDAGLENLAQLLGGSGSPVKYMALGTGKADYGTTPPTITPPQPTDSQLENEVIRKEVTVSFPQPGDVRFTIVLDNPEGNGSGVVNYTEAGLILTDGTLFSYLTFYPRTKSSANSLTFEWNIHFRRLS